MDRRSFLRLLGMGAIGAATLDVERLLWVPGAKTIFLPPIEIFTPPVAFDWFAIEALRILENSLVFTQKVNRCYEREFTSAGSLIDVRLPSRYR